MTGLPFLRVFEKPFFNQVLEVERNANNKRYDEAICLSTID